MGLLTTQPWPRWVSGPLISLVVLLLLLVGNKKLGMSSPMRTVLTMLGAKRWSSYFDRDISDETWNLRFVVGTIIGGFVAWQWLGMQTPTALAPDFVELMDTWGVAREGYLPVELFGSAAISWKQVVYLLTGGLLVGFGARRGEGCTSGHGIMGVADLQRPSIVALAGFFVGGLIMSHLLLPHILIWLGV